MNLRSRWLLLCLLPTLVPGSVPAQAADPSRPNILFILADDLGIGDLQCYGNPHLETTSLNQLAQAGVRLTSHYAPSPLCAQSRAGYLTGRYNHRTGAIDVHSNRGLDRIALSEKTLGDWFRAAGYHTGLIGKWHNGVYCRDHLPHARGFDEFFGFPNGGQDYWKWNLLRNDRAVTHDCRYLSDVFNEEAVRFIRETHASGKPFALFLSHHAPHAPFQAPSALVQKYRTRLGTGRKDPVATIYAMIEAMDTGLGRVFQTLREEDLWEHTVIVFTSDNGAHLGNTPDGPAARYHAGYRGNKGDVGEQGIRVPAIVAWPGHLPAGRVENRPVHGCDWLPTLLSLANTDIEAEAARFDGIDVGPLLRGDRTESLSARVLPFQKNRYRPTAHSDAAIRCGRWKLVWPGAPVTMRKDSARDNPSYLRGVLHPHWEMPLDRELGPVPKFQEESPRLFDLVQDPAERHDVADEHPELVDELRLTYNLWFADVMRDWEQARESIVAHDKAYWRDRATPDPGVLFRDFWQWKRAPDADPKASDPLQVFRGFWNQSP